MLNEERDLLIKEVCTRIPYDVKCKFEDSNELKDVVPSLVYEQRYAIKNLIELSKLKS